MQGKYKLVRFHGSIYNNNAFICVNYTCPYGWNPLPGPGVQPRQVLTLRPSFEVWPLWRRTESSNTHTHTHTHTHT